MSHSFRDVHLGTATAKLTLRDDGTRLLSVEEPLGAYPDTLLDCLERWAHEAPDRTFVARRDAKGEWQRLSYAETLTRVRSLAQGLLNRELSAERPLAILSGNSIEHLLLALAAMYVGVPFAPVSPAYSLVSRDFGKLRHIVELLTPGLLMVDRAKDFAPALAAVQPADCECLAIDPAGYTGVSVFDELLDTPVTAAVDEARGTVTPDTIVKFLFTSGSTGMPKGVINTHRMLCANQEMLASLMPFMRDEPPVLVDWLPWNHTFGGNHNIGIVLYNGGSLYIDDGRPVPGEFETTIANLREIAPTVYFNVPKGFEILVDYLKREDSLRETFFSRLNLMFFAAAGLSQHIWDELDRLAIQTLGCKVGMLTGLGATETAPSAMFASLEESRSGVVGLPACGVTIKLVPNGGKLECRVKGPNVMPGYWRQPEVTAKSFDEEGFYCLGDAVKFIDPDDPQRGMRFDGRISEDFKLDTGTWVSVGPLRARIIEAGAPHVKDVVIAGLDKPYVSVMVFPDLEKCRELAGLGGAADAATVLASEPVRVRFLQMLRDLDAHSTGSSTRVRRAVLLSEPPRLDAHEITDKGSINQRAVLENRADIIDELYRDSPPPSVLRLD
ncbi:feruloyl-CoA synthase [Billgrantia montanilacus]|uniref:Feruloyl-CoA synthase n=1 Tax=Billgrantia montanilacus TaxID=2282305 RepID=A0A368TU21_9GAMM|nr:feruloyl-CoA synthase [Halomonas montanilacus]RCV88194.1 feruloyl-CoA synthase [Halomonas montanilacus]